MLEDRVELDAGEGAKAITKHLSVTTVGISMRDETNIKFYVQRLNISPDLTCEFRDDLDVDIAICAPDSPITRIAERYQRERGYPICIPITERGDHVTLDGAHALTLPLRFEPFRDAVMAASRRRSEPRPPHASYVAPAQHVMSLYRARDPGQGAWRYAMGEQLLRVGVKQRVFAALPVQSVGVLAQRLIDSVWNEVDIAFDDTDPPMPPLGMVERPLEQLVWWIGLQRSPGVLLPEIERGRDFHLRRWPDFGRLGLRRTDQIAMAAILCRRYESIETLHQETSQPLDQVVNFLNACHACGYLEWHDDTTPRPSTARATSPSIPSVSSPRKRSMFSHLRRALGIKGQPS